MDDIGQGVLEDYLRKIFNSSAGAAQDTPGTMARTAGDYATDVAAQHLGALPDVAYGAAVNIPEAVKSAHAIMRGEEPVPLSKPKFGIDWWNEFFKEHGLQSHEVDPIVHDAAIASSLISPVSDTLKLGSMGAKGALGALPVVTKTARKILTPIDKDVQAIERGMKREEEEHPRLEKLAEKVEGAEKRGTQLGYGLTANAELNPQSYGSPEAELSAGEHFAEMAQAYAAGGRTGYATLGAVDQHDDSDVNDALRIAKEPVADSSSNFWSNMGEGLKSAADKTLNYLRTTNARQSWEDLGNVAGHAAQSFVDDPVKFVVENSPTYAIATSGPQLLAANQKINELKQSGQHAEAAKIAGMLPLIAMGMIPGVGGEEKAAVKAGEEAAVSKALKIANEAKNEAAPAANAVQATRATQLPNIRRMDVPEAIRIAREEPHLIKAPEHTQSYYVGGPREVQSPEDLAKQRKQFDANVRQDPRGADWYDRYRAGIREVTGNDPRDNRWMSDQEAQWSSGVSPESELGFTIKENNASLMGMPVKSARPAQHEAHLAAIEANDPSLYQLGSKTGEYARKINPDQPVPPGATGVNDFRYAREWGYTEPGGEAQKNALTSAQHNFMDYETALAIDRANQEKVGGRSDWTGEKIQAAPWVRQKANDILDQRPNMIKKYLDKGMDPETARALAYEDAFDIAKNTITDYFPKHTAFATHEAIPGADTGHLPGSVNASQAEREAYSNDPRSTWANAPGNRDAIYSGLRLGDTGVAGRVLPTSKMTGMYTPPSGITEFNPGEVARPIVGFNTTATGAHELTPHDRAMLNAGESVRAYIDAQNAGAAHKVQAVAPGSEATSFSLPMGREATPEELKKLSEVSARHGLPDVVDTGQGLTVTRFYPPPPNQTGRGYHDPIGPTITGSPLPSETISTAKKVAEDIMKAAPQAEMAKRVKIDSIYQDFVDAWQKGEGSGAATKQMLDAVNVTPEARSAFDKNPYIPQNALNRAERDESWSQNWGVTRKDIQNARRIIGEGPGWVGRLETALKNGEVLPAVAGIALLGAASMQGAGQDASQ